MKIVYAVSSGTYSDYQVVAIFTTQELAQSYIDSYGAYGDFNDIEEFELDPNGRQVKSDLFAFKVSIDEDFSINYCHAAEYFEKEVGKIEYSETYRNLSTHDRKKPLEVFVNARDKTHAIKIASDKAREIKATVGWGNLIA